MIVPVVLALKHRLTACDYRVVDGPVKDYLFDILLKHRMERDILE
jgi:hypothetical protein